MIINDAHSDPPKVGNPDATDETSADESFKEEVALPQRSARHKQPTPRGLLSM